LSANLRGTIHGLIQRARNLTSEVNGHFNFLVMRSDYSVEENLSKDYFEMYNRIRYDIIALFSSDKTVQSLPYLPYKNNHRTELLRLTAGLKQIIGFLEGKQIDVLGTTVRTFPYNEKELDVLPTTTKLLLLEAIGEYNYLHTYACCCICGLALESLVQEGCRKNDLSYEGLAKGIGALKEDKVIKEDLHKSLIDLEKYYRDKISAHLTSEIATDEKARLFLSSLLSLAKAIFPNEKK